jgi:hypothetical protein
MCRNIKLLFNFDPPTTETEIREASIQFVRKVSGSTKPSKANAAAFEKAVDDIAHSVRELLDNLVTQTPPKNRASEQAKAHARNQQRFGASR